MGSRRALAAVSLVRTGLRADRPSTALLVILVLVTAFLAAAGPRLFAAAANAGLRDAITSAAPAQRNLEFTRSARIEPGPGHALDGVEAAGAELEAALPASVAGLVSDRSDVVESIEFLIIDSARAGSQLAIRVQPDALERITFVEGRAPTGSLERVEAPDRQTVEGLPLMAVVMEAAVSTGTAETLELTLGDRLFLVPDPELSAGGFEYAAIDLVGIFAIDDPEEPFWSNDPSLESPIDERVTMDLTIFHATVLCAPEVYEALYGGGEVGGFGLNAGFPFQYTWRFLLDPALVDAGGVDTLATDLTRLQATYPFAPASSTADRASLNTGLSGIVADYGEQRATSEVALAIASIGPGVSAVGALTLMAMLRGQRRRDAMLLARGRGASGDQLLGAQLLEGLLVVVPMAALGYAAARLLIEGPDTPTAAVAALLVAAGTVTLTVLVAAPSARSPLRVAEREPGGHLRPGPQRLVFETLVVVIAVVGVVSLLQRGVQTGATSGVDPFLAAVPVLLGFAAGLVVLRLYPLPISLLALLGGARRGLVAMLALKSAAREPLVGRLPLLVLLIATAMGVFSSLLQGTLEREQTRAAWQAIGADFRIDAGLNGAIPTDLRPTTMAGVEGQAAATLTRAAFATDPTRRERIQVMGLDVPAYARIVEGTPADPGFSATFSRASWTEGRTGTSDDPVPAILSVEASRSSGLTVGESFQLLMPGEEAAARVEGVRASFPGLPGEQALMVPDAALRAAFPEQAFLIGVLYLRGGPEAEPDLRAAIDAYPGDLRLRSRPGLYARLHDTPLVAAVNGGFALGVAIALAYAALTVGAGLGLALAARRRQLALLRTLGLRRSDVISLIVLEHAPLILIALATGVGLGIGICWLLVPALGLEAFTGSSARVVLEVDWTNALIVVMGPLLVMSLVTLVAAWLVQRSDLARAVRGVQP